MNFIPCRKQGNRRGKILLIMEDNCEGEEALVRQPSLKGSFCVAKEFVKERKKARLAEKT